jgi:hypothetical protein
MIFPNSIALAHQKHLPSTIKLSLTSLALSIPLLNILPARSQVSISPLVIEVQAKRGQGQGLITVGNSSNEAFRARVYAEPFIYNRETGFEVLTSSPNDLRPYLQFSPTELAVPAGVERRVRFIVRFPPSQPEGEYRAIIFTQNLKEVSSTDGSGNKIGITARIGVAVYVRIGDVKPNLSVASTSFNAEKNEIKLLVRNTGKASAGPVVHWTLKQGEKTVKTGKVESSWITAESDRNLTLLSEKLAPGKYQLEGKLEWGASDRPDTLPFNLDLEIPSKTAASPSS